MTEIAKKHILAIGLIAVAAFLVYSNTFHASFHLDDVPQIVENPKIKDLKYLPELLMGQRGIADASFALNYAVGGLNVFGYHLVNIIIHIINGILVYFLISLTLKRTLHADQASKVPLYTALLFAVHPVHTQAVTYIVQRMESLASLFYLLALLLFIKGASAKKAVSAIILYSGVVLAYFLGFKSKEIAITLPAIIFLYDLYFVSGGNIKTMLRRWPLYMILGFLLVYLASKTMVPSSAVGAITGSGFNDVSEASAGFAVKQISPLQYLYTQFNVIMTYLRLLILPFKQNLDYDYPISKTLFELRTFMSFSGILAILSTAIYLFIKPVSRITNHGRFISFFILWFFVILSPTSSFVPIVDVIFEHRVYLASVGFMAIFVILFDETFDRLTTLRNRRQDC
ncbi:MAG: hypothetical protein Q7T53_05645 [Deltaproteobacteria bacterium]|nr:hypothetical protein [Deltaproteobacteria bacterium]